MDLEVADFLKEGLAIEEMLSDERHEKGTP